MQLLRTLHATILRRIGALTADWLVLCTTIGGLALAAMALAQPDPEELARRISDTMAPPPGP